MVRENQLAAVAGVLLLAAGAAAAQTEPVAPNAGTTIFGTADIQLERVQTTGSTNPAEDKLARQRVSNISSDLGIRKIFNLGDGLSATVQYITAISLDSGSGNANGGLWANAKDSFAAISKNGVGTLKAGRMTGAARWNSGTADFSPAGAGPQDNQGPQSEISGLTGAAPLFNVRLDNAVGFESASFGGFSVRGYYSANENKSNATPASGDSLSDDSFSLGAEYVTGPLTLRLSAEQRNDKGTLNNTTNRKTQDTDYKIGVKYAIQPNLIMGFGWDTMRFTDNSATGTQLTNLSRDGWILSLRYETGKHVIYGGYGQAANARGQLATGASFDSSSTGASQFTVAYNYKVSKELLWEVFASQVQNQSRAKYDFDSGSLSAGAGSTVTAIGAGFRLTF